MGADETDVDSGEPRPVKVGPAARSALTLSGGSAIDWEQTVVADAPESPAQKLRRGWPLVLPALAGLAVAIVAIAMLGGGGASTTVVSSGPVSQAAYTTGRLPGFKFSMNIETTVAGHSYPVEGTGSMDPQAREGSITVQAGGVTIQELIKNPFFYIKLPSTLAAGGKEWAKVDFTASTAGLVGSTSGPGSGNPAQLLEILKASGAVTSVGTQSLDGVSTTHYHALVDLERYAALAPQDERAAAHESAEALKHISGSSVIPIDIWVDSAKHVRRVSMEFQLCSAAGRVGESLSMDFYDFGAQPPVVPPPESQVTDVTGAMQSALSQGQAGLTHAAQQLGC